MWFNSERVIHLGFRPRKSPTSTAVPVAAALACAEAGYVVTICVRLSSRCGRWCLRNTGLLLGTRSNAAIPIGILSVCLSQWETWVVVSGVMLWKGNWNVCLATYHLLAWRCAPLLYELRHGHSPGGAPKVAVIHLGRCEKVKNSLPMQHVTWQSAKIPKKCFFYRIFGIYSLQSTIELGRKMLLILTGIWKVKVGWSPQYMDEHYVLRPF